MAHSTRLIQKTHLLGKNKVMAKTSSLLSISKRILARIGGWYIIIAILLTQVIASVTLFIGSAFEQLNVDYSPEAQSLLDKIEIIGVPVAFIVLLSISFLLSRSIFARLRYLKSNPELSANQTDTPAWKDLNSITWKYAIALVAASFVFIIIPRSLILYYSGLATTEQAIYIFIAGVVTDLAFIPLMTVLFDKLLIPVRILLLPNEFEQQLAGRGVSKLLYKNLSIVIISLLLITLLIAPTRVLYESIGPQSLLTDLQIWSIWMSVFTILFTAGLSFLIAQSTSVPLGQLVETFQKVEAGDFSSRAPVISADEIGELAIYFNRMVARLGDLQNTLEEKVEERTSQLTAINTIGRVSTSILDPDELLNRIVNLISEEFGYYHSAVYIIDTTGQWAELKDATGEAGKVLLESKHRLKIDISNIIGQAITSRQSIMFTTSGEHSPQFNNPLLPYTRSEVSLPLFIGDRILGALDVQSTEEDAFSEDKVNTLQSMANQIAISLDNARLFQETLQRLDEMRIIQKQYLREAWIDTNLPQGEISLSIGGNIVGDEKNLVSVPIALRDQIIGHISIEPNEPLSEDEKSWVQAIATQAAVALENARLIEDSQGTAMREKFVSEINNKIWASTTIDGVLQTAVRELGQILDASEATIEISIDGE